MGNEATSGGPALVVLAAGLGTRYGSLKQLDPLGPGGSTLLDYALADAWRAGYTHGVVVVREDIVEALEAHLERTVEGRMPVELVVQRLDDLPGGHTSPAARRKPWGTAHAVWAARRALSGPFVVANADDYYGHEAYEVLAEHLAGRLPTSVEGGDIRDAAGERAPDAARPAAGTSARPEPRAASRPAPPGGADPGPPWGLAAYRLGDVLSRHGPVNRGLCRVDGDGWLRDVIEGRDLAWAPDGAVEGRTREGGPVRLTGDEPVSTNLWGFTPSALPFLEEGLSRFLDGRGREDPRDECLLPDVIREGLAEGRCRVRVRQVNATFFGVTHPEDRPGVVERLTELGPAWGATQEAS